MSLKQLSPEQILGLDAMHLIEVQNHQLEPNTAEAFLRMQSAALKEGFALTIISSYRSFERQCHIWNQKALGQRPVLDIQNQPIDISKLSEQECMHAILNWSALPGTSRHHWGTDFDIYDAHSIDAKDVQLISTEYLNEGVCSGLYDWLQSNANNYGFFWPYATDRGGIQVEPWHLSYAPVAQPALRDFPETLLKKTLVTQNIQLKKACLSELDAILKRYVYKVDQPKSLTG